MLKEATISKDGIYRYTLLRMWERAKKVLVVVMVNPSTADAEVDDPTILTLIARAKLWGFGGILVVNLYAYRSSTPQALGAVDDPSGPDNATWLEDALHYAEDSKGWVLVAWGNNGQTNEALGIDRLFCISAKGRGVELRCLGLTASGAPKHPLARGVHRVPIDFEPVVFTLP